MPSSSSLPRQKLRSRSPRARPGPSGQPHRISMEIPDRFKGVDSEDDERDGAGNADENMGMVAQSFYGMVAAVQTNETIQQALEGESDSEGEAKDAMEALEQGTSARSFPNTLSRETARRKSPPEVNTHRKRVSDNKRLSRLVQPIRDRSGSQAEDDMTQSQILPPKNSMAEERKPPGRSSSATGMRNDAPVLDRKLQAQARANMDTMTTPSTLGQGRSSALDPGPSNKTAPIPLPVALAEIFHFDEPETVISEYPCWYLQSVLLQGYMYITQQHVCFYAYLQKRGNSVIKSGHLGKQGKRNPRYTRYWFVLKGDVLSYFPSASEPYFPHGTINLRDGISADIALDKSKGKETDAFTITTDRRTYYFRADSATSAREWVKQLQKVIFRSHNDGDSVKISFPIANVVDVESNPIIDFAETVKIRVIENDETYAVEEYFFTFFSLGKDALRVLGLLTEDNKAKQAAKDVLNNETFAPLSKATASPFRQSISPERSPHQELPALSQAQPSRSRLPASNTAVGDGPEILKKGLNLPQASSNRGRRSLSINRNRRSSQSQGSSESFVTSTEQQSGLPSTSDTQGDDMSASQILSGDGAFRAPTIKSSQKRSTIPGSGERRKNASQEVSKLKSHADQTDSQLNTGALAEQSADDTKGKQEVAENKTVRTRPTPLHYAYTLSDHVRSQSKRVGSYLGSSPKDYLNKFSGAIAGGKRHYLGTDGLAPGDEVEDTDEEFDRAEDERRFQQHFSLPGSEKLVAVFYCWLHRVLPLYGKIYIGTRRFCFRSLLYGTRTKLNVPLHALVNLQKEKGFRWGYPGMVVVIRGHEEVFFDFASHGLRDDCVVTVLRQLEYTRGIGASLIQTKDEKLYAEAAAAENELLRGARTDSHAEQDLKVRQHVDQNESEISPIFFDDPNASVLEFKPTKSLRITCLTIGSRGDVQPYVALCKGLKADGHRPVIATHHEFEEFVTKHGIDFVPVDGDPAELMRICVENGMFTPSFLYEANFKFRGWLEGLLTSSYTACKGSDLLIESPSAMAGIHIAEALGIPYFRAFTMPWTRTRAYPHAFAVPKSKLGGQYNYMSYVLFDTMFWQVTAGQINRWRGKVLGLKPTSLEKLQPNKVPFLYNFSPSVVVPPLDFSDWVRVTGYWFLDEGDSYQPDNKLLAFITKAREDDKKLVYIGFGSVTVSDSRLLTQQVVEAVDKADVRCILSKGWSDRFETRDASIPEVKIPDSIFEIRAAPHDWLFKQVDAVVHHGGAGTTGASLRAGVPTIIKPFFGDQNFFATRVEDLGVGIHLKKVTVNGLGRALWIATHDYRIQSKARLLGEQIRQENGVATAIQAIYRDLEYANTLIKKREVRSAMVADDDELEEDEESWTFVESESDVDVTGSRGSESMSRSVPQSIYTQLGRQSGFGSTTLETAPGAGV